MSLACLPNGYTAAFKGGGVNPRLLLKHDGAELMRSNVGYVVVAAAVVVVVVFGRGMDEADTVVACCDKVDPFKLCKGNAMSRYFCLCNTTFFLAAVHRGSSVFLSVEGGRNAGGGTTMRLSALVGGCVGTTYLWWERRKWRLCFNFAFTRVNLFL